MTGPVWVVDTSSIIEIRRLVINAKRRHVFAALTNLVSSERLNFPKQVVDELRRAANPGSKDSQLEWAEQVEITACSIECTYAEVREVLAQVPEILAAGILGIPSVPLRGLLRFERISEE